MWPSTENDVHPALLRRRIREKCGEAGNVVAGRNGSPRFAAVAKVPVAKVPPRGESSIWKIWRDASPV